MKIFKYVTMLFLILTVCLPAAAEEVQTKITLASGLESKTYLLKDLKERLSSKSLKVTRHPAYEGKAMDYTGFDLAEVLKLIPGNDKITAKDYNVVITCLDGFKPVISSKMFVKDRMALLAYQETEGTQNEPITSDKKWSKVSLKGKMVNPGPFYLVWNSAKGTYPMGWPFQIKEIKIEAK
jgi:hypothetical protein